tara:strand:- start:273 stop:485 length:213 start_codon:yes stop_codon:yes gene_type:complete
MQQYTDKALSYASKSFLHKDLFPVGGVLIFGGPRARRKMLKDIPSKRSLVATAGGHSTNIYVDTKIIRYK